MVSSMSTTNQLYLPKKVTLTTKFNFDSIFYVRYKSEEISPLDSQTEKGEFLTCYKKVIAMCRYRGLYLFEN